MNKEQMETLFREIGEDIQAMAEKIKKLDKRVMAHTEEITREQERFDRDSKDIWKAISDYRKEVENVKK